MGRLSFREGPAFTKRFDALGGWHNDDLDKVMVAALEAMTMHPQKQPIVNKEFDIRVVETEQFRSIPAMEIFFYRPDKHTVEAIDMIEYPADETT